MMDTTIHERLDAAERQHQVRIVYACESGSRAWGFASPDSDYDVRFIYVRDLAWYASFDVEHRRDVIEYPIVDLIDCGGWDLRKALYLFTRTNGALLEWLHSPIVYRETDGTAAALRALAPEALSSIALCYHYSHMARRNAGEHLSGDRVRLKKYFYVLRPLLAIRHIEQGLGLPPVSFEKLVETVAPPELRVPIEHLLEVKRNTDEIGFGDRVPAVSDFIAAELERHGDAFSGPGRPDIATGAAIRERLNKIFHSAIGLGEG